MSVDNIVDKILQDAQKKADAVIDESRLKEKDLCVHMQGEIKLQEEGILAQARAKAEDFSKRLLSDARLGARKEILSAKQSLIDDAFAAAIKDFCQMPIDKYRNLIRCLIIACLGTGQQWIIPSMTDEKKIDEKLIEEINKEIKAKRLDACLALSKEYSKTLKSGFILKADTFQIQNSIEDFVLSNKEAIVSKAAEILFK